MLPLLAEQPTTSKVGWIFSWVHICVTWDATGRSDITARGLPVVLRRKRTVLVRMPSAWCPLLGRTPGCSGCFWGRGCRRGGTSVYFLSFFLWYLFFFSAVLAHNKWATCAIHAAAGIRGMPRSPVFSFSVFMFPWLLLAYRIFRLKLQSKSRGETWSKTVMCVLQTENTWDEADEVIPSTRYR